MSELRQSITSTVHCGPEALSALENNPWNPGTRYVMSRIPFDRDAIPLTPSAARHLLKRAALRPANGFSVDLAQGAPLVCRAHCAADLRGAHPYGRGDGYYNPRVTGDPLRLPRFLHYETYGTAPVFLWQNPRPEPAYRHKVMWDFYVGRDLSSNVQKYSLPNLAMMFVQKLKRLWQFYLGLVLTIPLLALPWMMRNRWMRFALLTCGAFMVALMLHRWAFLHYAAPIAGLIFALVLQAMRHLHVWQWRGRPTGRFIVRAIPLICAAWFVLSLAKKIQVKPAHAWSLQRARILVELKEEQGRHLVIVRYGPRHLEHDEWVYNEAEIDGARVLWARDMDAATIASYWSILRTDAYGC
jgi:hypothetical protein